MTPQLPEGLGLVSGERTGDARFTAAGLVVLMAGGVLAALLAARWLNPAGYTVFAAFSAVLGLLVLGPASSLEQESALYGSRSQLDLRSVAGRMTTRAAMVWLLATIIVLTPVADWQQRLWGDASLLARTLIVLSVPPIFTLAITRGIAAALGAHRVVGGVYAVAGLGLVGFPPVLHLLGLSRLSAFLVGAVVAWLPPLLVLTFATRGHSRASPPAAGVGERHPRSATAWIVFGNLLVLGNLLAVPAVLRWHVGQLDVALVADVQLLVSISRLSTTVVLGFLPLAIARLASPSDHRDRDIRRLILIALSIGTGAVVACAMLGAVFIALLTGRPASVETGDIVLATLPVMALCPAIVLTGLAISRGRHLRVLLSWGLGLLTLAGATGIDAQGGIHTVLGAVLLAGFLPLFFLASAFVLGPVVRRADGRMPP